jgi:hypothetical protein
MLLITTYKIAGDRTQQAAADLMKRFGEMGAAPGQIAHYVFADGSGGVVIADENDTKSLHAQALAYSQWLDFDTKIALTVEDAVPGILEALQR